MKDRGPCACADDGRTIFLVLDHHVLLLPDHNRALRSMAQEGTHAGDTDDSELTPSPHSGMSKQQQQESVGVVRCLRGESAAASL